MTTLYHPFPIKCFNRFKEETLRYMNQFHGDRLYIKSFPISDDLLNVFNKEMTEYGLPSALNFLCFKRKDFFKETMRVHIDTNIKDEQIYSSIVLPLEGCEDTHMYWMDGEYEIVCKKTDAGSNYSVTRWKSIPKLIDKVEICKEPYLTKVNVPHDAISRSDGSYRTILSIRLQGNPTFEEVLQKRFDNKSQT